MATRHLPVRNTDGSARDQQEALGKQGRGAEGGLRCWPRGGPGGPPAWRQPPWGPGAVPAAPPPGSSRRSGTGPQRAPSSQHPCPKTPCSQVRWPRGASPHGALFPELAVADSAGRGHSSRSSHARVPPPNPWGCLGVFTSPAGPCTQANLPSLCRSPRVLCAHGRCPGDSPLATGGPEPGGLSTTVHPASSPAVGSVTRGTARTPKSG